MKLVSLIIVVSCVVVGVSQAQAVDESVTGNNVVIPEPIPMPPICYEPYVDEDGIKHCQESPSGNLLQQCMTVLNAKVNEVDGLEKESLALKLKYEALSKKYSSIKKKCGRKCR